MASKIVGRLSSELSNLPKLIKPNLKKFWYYAKVELTPPSPADIMEIKSGYQNLVSGYKRGAWKEITVRQAWLNILVATEVGLWFYIGECIGKRSLVGYQV